ncbi:MAG TPA: S8 family serine peptidase, partial [Pyrinomonadaceae bacterium]|nr:S8 family serine peptidase [Pyrinomonadaceae bacterium]
MNRNNLLGHVALALTLVLVAAFAGQVRRWNRQAELLPPPPPAVVEAPPVTPAEVGDENAEVIVRFRPGTSLEQMERLAARLNDRLEDQYEYVRGYAVVEDSDGLDAQAVADEYLSQAEVEWAEPNVRIELNDPSEEGLMDRLHSSFVERPNDPMLGEQWGLINTGQRNGRDRADIGAIHAWLKKTTGSEDIVVAVLDTGVDYTHTDLMNNIWLRPETVAAYRDKQLGTIDDLHGYNAADNNGDPMDDNGHGTHCAGIIGAEGNNGRGIAGVNWRVQIMPLKFLGSGGSGTTKDAIEAINYAIDRKKSGVNLRIISASWGSTARSRALEEAIKRAGEEGILFVAAAGNSSVNNDRTPHYPSSYPLPNVLAVAALDRHDALASFSNFGERSVHVAAPGKEILSTWLDDDFREASGTSMATPMVSGVAALVLAVEPNLTVAELR